MQTRRIGMVVVIIGIVMIIYTGFNYVTTEEVVDLGAIKINQQENHPVQWSPIVGMVLLIGGAAIILFGKKARL